MRRRTQHDSVWSHMSAYGSEIFWVPAIVIALFGWFMTVLIYCSIVSDQNDLREGQFKIVHALEHARQTGTTGDVEEMAKSLILTHKNDFGVSELDDKDFRKGVIESSKTGTIPVVTMPHATWDEFLPGKDDLLTSWLSLGILATLALMSCAGSLCYANECSERREFIADLNLRKPSHVAFVLCTPLLWLFYPISLIGMRADTRQQQQRNQRTQVSTDGFERDVARRLAEALDSINSLAKAPETFVDDRAGALETYHRICGELAVSNVERRKKQLGERIKNLGEEAADLSKAMRKTTQERTQAKTDLQALEKLDPASSVPDRETAEAQFNRLVNLRGVHEVWPLEKGIGLVVEARLEHEGTVYDLGAWKLEVTDKRVDGFEIRSGLQSGWSPYEYPAYRYGGGHFCFGERHPEMNERCQSGHLLEAAIIAVECLNSVNANDLKKVPKAFKKAPK